MTKDLYLSSYSGGEEIFTDCERYSAFSFEIRDVGTTGTDAAALMTEISYNSEPTSKGTKAAIDSFGS